MRVQVVAAYLANYKRKRRRPDPAPDGFMYQVDENGNTVYGEDGEPVLIPKP